MLQFSIVIPAFNAEAHIAGCLRSALAQDIGPDAFEILLVDDGSTDGTRAAAEALAAGRGNLRLLRTAANGGPGVARNLGVEQARGEWIVFLDSDDALHPQTLSRLGAFLADPGNQDCDAVGFDFHHMDEPATIGARRDQGALLGGRAALLRSYLSLHMDGSVIFTAVRRGLLTGQRLAFASGLHEDVDYLFRVYWHARRVGYLDAVLYGKSRRAGSIVNTISDRHIRGFVRAWAEIGGFLAGSDGAAEHLAAWRVGLVGLVATRVREILLRAGDPEHAAPLYEALYAGWRSLQPLAGPVDLGASRTKYHQIARTFVAAMEDPAVTGPARAAALAAGVRDVLNRSWSCVDLHHSVFLAPDQVRTCCKRFFVDGEMRGDVVLLDTREAPDITADAIVRAKQRLLTAINREDPTPCDGCPFLEFKEWGPVAPLTLTYLSFEHHSVCNLECTYCSDTYYGGETPHYDVRGLVDGFIANGALAADATVVWGGGEPTADRSFTPIIESLVDRLPRLTQRVLTNAVTHSPTVERLLIAGNVAITTSVDAGTRETFTRVRGRDRLAQVIRTLRKYAAAADRVTLKYIFTDGNESLDECRAFMALMREAGLLRCNYQISHDFKRPTVEEAVLVSAIALYGMLIEAGCQVVFFDDLLRHRLVGMEPAVEMSVRRQLASLGLGSTVADVHDVEGLVIWGAGWQARYLLENAALFRRTKPAFLVDSTPSKIGGEFMGLRVRDPRELLESDAPVLIAAVQGYRGIYDQFRALGLPPARLVTKLVI